MFKKILASVGIGAAQVDTRLFNAALCPGEMLEGEVKITGGDVEQEIDDIYLKVITEYEREVEDSTVREECILANDRLSEKFTLQAKERKTIPFSLLLPYETPLTIGRQPVYLRTGLDIKTALDPKDRDAIEVLPHPLMQKVLSAIENLGFKLTEVDCEYAPHWGRYPFVQEFEFKPTGKYRDRLDELEVIFNLSQNELEVLLQLDKKSRGWKGVWDEVRNLDERYVRLRVDEYDADLEMMLEDAIENYSR
jgi:sporulation-control protein